MLLCMIVFKNAKKNIDFIKKKLLSGKKNIRMTKKILRFKWTTRILEILFFKWRFWKWFKWCIISAGSLLSKFNLIFRMNPKLEYLVLPLNQLTLSPKLSSSLNNKFRTTESFEMNKINWHFLLYHSVRWPDADKKFAKMHFYIWPQIVFFTEFLVDHRNNKTHRRTKSLWNDHEDPNPFFLTLGRGWADG